MVSAALKSICSKPETNIGMAKMMIEDIIGPLIISMLFFWPVLITQIWGMIEQSSLDDKALEIAEKVIAEQGGNTMSFVSNEYCFCTACGTKNPIGAKFCCGCGKEL